MPTRLVFQHGSSESQSSSAVKSSLDPLQMTAATADQGSDDPTSSTEQQARCSCLPWLLNHSRQEGTHLKQVQPDTCSNSNPFQSQMGAPRGHVQKLGLIIRATSHMSPVLEGPLPHSELLPYLRLHGSSCIAWSALQVGVAAPCTSYCIIWAEPTAISAVQQPRMSTFLHRNTAQPLGHFNVALPLCPCICRAAPHAPSPGTWCRFRGVHPCAGSAWQGLIHPGAGRSGLPPTQVYGCCSVHYVSLLGSNGHQTATPFVISTVLAGPAASLMATPFMNIDDNQHRDGYISY
jgi:hypothetical protein